jgi:preprotein translocase subunit SecA
LEIIKKAGYKQEDYEKKEKEIGEEKMREVEKIVSLRVLDDFWMEHLENMEHLRDSVRLRAYGQRDPLVEYKTEGHKMFQKLLGIIEFSTADMILKVGLVKEPSIQQQPVAFSKSKDRVGRNDPCPCGAKYPDGRPVKYKKCHGK